MPTPAEQKALSFVALVILLAGAMRVVRGGALSPSAATAAEQQALAQQATAASAAADQQAARKSGKTARSPGKAPRRRYTGAKFDSGGVLVEGSGVSSASLSPLGFPAPGPRIDSYARAAPGRASGSLPDAQGAPGPPVAPVDIDLAPADEIGRIKGVSRTLAKRIVANRDSLGPFGSLPALRRVKGVGRATLERLAPHVTFSGQARR